MNLKLLIKKIEKINELHKELELYDKYYLVVSSKYETPIYIYKSKDLKIIEEVYINEISNKIINNEIIKEERYMYKITDTDYEIRVGVDEL